MILLQDQTCRLQVKCGEHWVDVKMVPQQHRLFSLASYLKIRCLQLRARNYCQRKIRDTLRLKLGPTLPELDEIPEICRNAVVEWNQNVTKLADVLIGLLCDGLGVEKRRMEEMNIVEGRMMVAHYYPYCPQPDLTVGIKSHTDPGALTILLQDQKGGLQVKYGDQWVDVKPVPGALVINIGDLLQIMSNDEYKSIEHRVLANRVQDPRISTAVFLAPSGWDCFYGPLAELVSSKKPAHYRRFTYTDFMRRFHTKELDGKSLINYYTLENRVKG